MSRALLLVAHGSPDPRAQASTTRVAEAVRAELTGVNVGVGYLEHATPTVPDAYAVLAAEHEAVTVVPLLFTPGFHAAADLPEQLGGAPADVTPPLGAHPLVAAALSDGLIDAGAEAGHPVVLVYAGSKEPAATAEVDALADLVARLGRCPVTVATPDGLTTAVRSAQAHQDGPVTAALLLLAPGVFADRLQAEALAAGASAVTAPIGEHPSIATLIALRYAATTRTPGVAA